MNMAERCDWCGQFCGDATTGIVVSQNGKERRGHICYPHKCRKTPREFANPIFKTKWAWGKWKRKHPTLASRIMAHGGINIGNAWVDFTEG
jgi:hypothetical protein